MSDKDSGPQIRNRLGVILATLALEGKHVSQKELAQGTGVAESTISSYVNNQVTRYDARVIAAIVDFLRIDISNFFEFIPAGRDEIEEGESWALTTA